MIEKYLGMMELLSSDGSEGNGGDTPEDETSPCGNGGNGDCPGEDEEESCPVESDDPVRYFNGEIVLEPRDLRAPVRAFGHGRSFSNRMQDVYQGPNGNNWLLSDWPQLIESGPDTLVAMFGQNRIWFDWDGSSYTARHGADDRYSLEEEGDLLVLRRQTGRGIEVIRFHNFEQTAHPPGLPQRGTDEWGNTWEAIAYSDNWIQELRWQAKDEDEAAYALVYDYYGSGPHEERIQTATLKKTEDLTASPVVWEELRRAEYHYYQDADPDGSNNDLKLVVQQMPDGSGGWEDVARTHYRYYVDEEGGIGYPHGLKYVVDPQACAEMEEDGLDPLTEDDSTVADYATHYFEYDGEGKVTKEKARDCAGCSGGGTGEGGETFSRQENASQPEGYNLWRWKITHTLAGGNTKLVYTNYLGQMLLEELQEEGTANTWLRYKEYGEAAHNAGKLIREASPSAVEGYDEGFDDLAVQLKSGQGLIRHREYYDSTNADGETPGGVKGKLQRELVQEGTGGDQIPQRKLEYKTSTNTSGQRAHVIGRETRYVDESASPTQEIQTEYTYSWYSDPPTAMKEKITTLPAISSSQHGDGTSAERKEFFDRQGRLTWQMDERGIIDKLEYLKGTELMVKQTRDVDSSASPPWSVTSGDHLSLVSEFEHDGLGRRIEELGPEHEVELDGTAAMVRSATWHVYKEATDRDQRWSGRGYRKISDDSNHLVDPVTIAIRDKHGRELHQIESKRSSGSGRLSGTDTFDRADWTRWTASTYTAAGQLEEQRLYHQIPAQSPDQGLEGAGSDTGTKDTHYALTLFGYDKDTHQQVRQVSPGGTIRRRVFDGIQRLISEWVGTDDTPDEGDWADWSPANNTGDADMVKIAEYEYDQGGDGGDSHLTKETRHVDGSTSRVTSFSYDHRGRRLTEDGEESRFLEHSYDNLGRRTMSEQRDGSGSGQLVARIESFFDDRDRVYEEKMHEVDPDTGSVGNALSTRSWFDAAGNVVKQVAAGDGGAYTTLVYDNLGRQTEQARAYEHDTDGEVIVEKQVMTLNEVGSVLEIQTEQLDTGASTSSPSYRTRYTAMWYDGIGRMIAQANYGALSSFSRPSTTPSRSDTVLVTSFEYDEAGQQASVTDPMGRVTSHEYDDAGREVKLIENEVASPSSPDESRTTETAYNPEGQVATLTAKNGHTGDQVTTYLYGVSTGQGSELNSESLLFAIEYPEDSASSRVELTYNRQGQLIERQDQAGTVHVFEYDKLGRQVQDRAASLGSGVDDSVRRIATSYTLRGQVETVTSYDDEAVGAGSVLNQVKREYDGFGRIVAEHQEHAGQVSTSTTPAVQYSHADGSENLARLTQLTYPNGRGIGYTYSGSATDAALSRVSAIADGATTLVSYAYLGAGMATRVDYDQADVRLDLWGGTAGSYAGIDRFGRVVDQRWEDYGSSSDAARLKHGYDRDSNRLYRRDVAARSSSAEFDELYSYDGLDRLAGMERGLLNSANDSISSKSFAQDWNLDAVGNWQAFDEDADGDGTPDLAQDRSHNTVNEITAITNTTGSSWAGTGHDPAGNMTSFPSALDPTQGHQATYDAWNRMVAVDDGNDILAEYAFDGGGRRIVEKTYDGGSLDQTRHVYYSHQWQRLEERVDGMGNGDVEMQYVWGGRYVDDLVCRDRDTTGDGSADQRLYALQDANFNVVALVDTSGSVVERYAYSPYGERTVLDASFGELSASNYAWRIGHQDLHHDEATGLVDNRARMLHPRLGRFVQRDPLDQNESGGGYQDGLNLYQYVGSAPNQWTDSSGTRRNRPRGQKFSVCRGLCPEEVCRGCCAMVAAAQIKSATMAYAKALKICSRLFFPKAVAVCVASASAVYAATVAVIATRTVLCQRRCSN